MGLWGEVQDRGAAVVRARKNMRLARIGMMRAMLGV